MTKIDKNIPAPDYKTGIKYPFKDMEIDDSFTVTLSGDIRKQTQSIGGQASQFRKKHNVKWKFITRKDGDKMRIWRVE